MNERMNERIKQLVEKAPYTTVSTEGRLFSQQDLAKFAELIVAECVAITDDLVNRNRDGSWTSDELYTDYNGALSEVKQRIQDNFGVEE